MHRMPPHTGRTLRVQVPADGTSAPLLGIDTRRTGWLVMNESGVDARISFSVQPGVKLDDNNSIILRSGASIGDDTPALYNGRVIGASTTAAALTLDVVSHSR